MISICTPTYNTPLHVLARTWASLKRQTLPANEWEWVIYDDSTTDSVWQQLYGICADERYNVRVYRCNQPTGGMIGAAKRDAFMLARGEWLLELDHDDELLPTCLEEVKKATKSNPDFIYSDWCEIDPHGNSMTYPEGWGLGYGKTVKTEIDQYGEVFQHVLSGLDEGHLAHIVGIPNHVRVWNAKKYREVGGHDHTLPIADDYELYLRTYNGNIHHINKLLYVQHIGSHTQQRQRNGLIQKLVSEIYEKYKEDDIPST